jgi:hypothetical protein
MVLAGVVREIIDNRDFKKRGIRLDKELIDWVWL